MSTTYTQRKYEHSQDTKKARQELEKHNAARPEDYESQWLQQLDALAQQLLSRPAFSYDPYSDPLYGLYRDNYVNQGRMAMEDTLGRAAQLTGGYGNSYAQLAGQQAYQNSLTQLNDFVPQLYQLALQGYDMGNQSLLNQYGIASDREAMDYSRYQDGYGLWADQRDYLTGRYDTQQGFDYTQFRDLVADDQWLASFNEDLRRFNFANKLGEFKPPKVTYTPSSSSSGGNYAPPKKDPEEKKKKPTTTGPKVVLL